MASFGETFVAADLPMGKSFEPLPAGWYTAAITQATVKDTKAGTGRYISLKYDITGPSHQGRTIFGNLNISNPNPKAEEIGRQQLNSLMRAIGLAKVNDTDQLIGGQLKIKLAITTSDQYGEGNDVKDFATIGGGSMPAASKPAAPAAGAKAAPPWAK